LHHYAAAISLLPEKENQTPHESRKGTHSGEKDQKVVSGLLKNKTKQQTTDSLLPIGTAYKECDP
jgi:hypothetical protein